MPAQDLPAARVKKGLVHEEKAIVRALVKYFETAPSKVKSPAGTAESSIINALHRYFDKK
jgi:hypothetical protein